MDNKNYRKFCIWCNTTYKSPHNYKLHLMTSKHKQNAKNKFSDYENIIIEADNDIMNFINKFENINYYDDLDYETALLLAYKNDIDLNFYENNLEIFDNTNIPSFF